MTQDKIADIEGFINKYDSAGTGSSAKEVFSKTQDTSVEALRESVSDIQKMIEDREKLHREIVEDIEKTEIEITNFLNKMPLEFEHNRDNLFLFKSKSIEVSQAKRQEKLNCWHDIARLKEELRKLKQQLNEKEKRQEMLDSIISK